MPRNGVPYDDRYKISLFYEGILQKTKIVKFDDRMCGWCQEMDTWMAQAIQDPHRWGYLEQYQEIVHGKVDEEYPAEIAGLVPAPKYRYRYYEGKGRKKQLLWGDDPFPGDKPGENFPHWILFDPEQPLTAQVIDDMKKTSTPSVEEPKKGKTRKGKAKQQLEV